VLRFILTEVGLQGSHGNPTPDFLCCSMCSCICNKETPDQATLQSKVDAMKAFKAKKRRHGETAAEKKATLDGLAQATFGEWKCTAFAHNVILHCVT
jgi:hypothetical protein